MRDIQLIKMMHDNEDDFEAKTNNYLNMEISMLILNSYYKKISAITKFRVQKGFTNSINY